MTPELRKALENQLQWYLDKWLEEPLLQTSADRAEIKLLTDVLSMAYLDRIAYHLENGQIAVINS